MIDLDGFSVKLYDDSLGLHCDVCNSMVGSGLDPAHWQVLSLLVSLAETHVSNGHALPQHVDRDGHDLPLCSIRLSYGVVDKMHWEVWIKPTLPEHYDGYPEAWPTDETPIDGEHGTTYWPTFEQAFEFMDAVLRKDYRVSPVSQLRRPGDRAKLHELVGFAADLWAGADTLPHWDDNEYARGQVELICDTVYQPDGVDAVDWKNDVWRLVRRRFEA